MTTTHCILAAFALDLLLGDPRWLPHPVRLMGLLAGLFERVARKLLRWERAAGAVTAVCLLVCCGGAAFGALELAGALHPWARDAVAILVIYSSIAARDLVRHSSDVYKALLSHDLPEARRRVGMIVGRDTAELDEGEVARAAVESVAESIVDGVTSPLFFALVAGPVGACVYRAANTMDSMFGYKNARYLRFGWAPARLDDLANWIPARLTAPLIVAAAFLLGHRSRDSLRILKRDARNHSSPNSGLAEAAVAGALGVRLGGANVYFGEPVEKPTIGDPRASLCPTHIQQANALMLAAAVLFLALGLAVRQGVILLWGRWG